MPNLPLFIVFEGIDGSGKTTLWNTLRNKLDNHKCIRFVREPDTRIFTKEIYELLKNKDKYHITIDHEISLFHLQRLVCQKLPSDCESDINNETWFKLNSDNMVISDRSIYSSLAYQSNRSTEWFDKVYSPEDVMKYNSGILIPGKIVYLDTDLDKASSRLSNRNDVDLFINEQKLVKNNYEYILKKLENELDIEVLRVSDKPIEDMVEEVFEFLYS